MPKKYHIHSKVTTMDFDYVFKFKITRGENCINCGKCTKVCIYEAHKRRTDDPRKMADPNTVVCRNCFRCIQECPRGALEKSIDKEYAAVGGTYWKPDTLLSLWKQAEDGKVPVSGAGYRGPFTGTGFDGMWTDMSEIVRPTRDGISGREYINTGVNLGRKLNHLTFDAEGQLVSKVPDTIDISMPVLFDITDMEMSPHVKEALLQAAEEVGTCVMVTAKEITPAVEKYANNLIPCLEYKDVNKYEAILKKTRFVAIDLDDSVLVNLPAVMDKVKKINNAIVIIRVPATRGVENTVAKLAHNGAEVINIMADYRGREIGNPAVTERRTRNW
jgi:ferredoxin